MKRQRHDSDGFIFSYLKLLFRVILELCVIHSVSVEVREEVSNKLLLNRDSIRPINIYAKRCAFYLDLAIKE